MEDLAQRTMEMARTFDASAPLIWEALTTPKYLKNWWGPEGFTLTIHQMELKVGGKWEFTMHGPDGTDFANTFYFLEIQTHTRIVMEHRQPPPFTLIVQLFPEGAKTKVLWQNVFDTVPTKEEAIRAYQADIGLKQNLDRFERHLGQTPA